MTDIERVVVERFPEHEKAIHTLSESNPQFSALCHEYGEASRKLCRLELAPNLYVRVETEILSRRCTALEDELIAMMRRNRRA
jgi:uncharacterized protein YdcH (DUF465 family)